MKAELARLIPPPLFFSFSGLLGVAEGTIQWVTYEHLKRKWSTPKNTSSTNTIGGKSPQGKETGWEEGLPNDSKRGILKSLFSNQNGWEI